VYETLYGHKYVKSKVVLLQSMEAFQRREDIAVLTGQEAGWAPQLVWTQARGKIHCL
jgi:hypothetical protein